MGDAVASKTTLNAALIGTCKLNGVNPEAYTAATLRKILDNHMQRDIPS